MAEGTSTESYEDSYKKAVLKLMENIAQHDPKVALKIMVEALFEDARMKIMDERSKELDIENPDELEALYPQKKVEFDTYLKLLKQADKDHDLRLMCALGWYIKKNHGKAYYQHLWYCL